MNNIVFWHGWGMHHSVWDALISHLKQRLHKDFQYHAKALPGYSDTAAPVPYSPEKVIDTLSASLPSSCILCAWSMGSMLALQLAYQYPEKIKKLVLIGSTPSFMQRHGWLHGIPDAVMTDFMEGVRQDAHAAIKRFIALFNQNDRQARQISRQLAHIALPPQPVLLDGLNLLKEMDLRFIIPKITLPSLLIHGEHDPLMPLHAAQWIQENMPDARLSVIPSTAHAPFLSNPGECAKLISNFIRNV